MVGWNSMVGGACGTGGSSLHGRQEAENKGSKVRNYLPRHCPAISFLLRAKTPLAFSIAQPIGAIHIQTIQLNAYGPFSPTESHCLKLILMSYDLE